MLPGESDEILFEYLTKELFVNILNLEKVLEKRI